MKIYPTLKDKKEWSRQKEIIRAKLLAYITGEKQSRTNYIQFICLGTTYRIRNNPVVLKAIYKQANKSLFAKTNIPQSTIEKIKEDLNGTI